MEKQIQAVETDCNHNLGIMKVIAWGKLFRIHKEHSY